MLIWPLIARRFGDVTEVDTVGAVQLINRRDAVVLDVREQHEYAAGHIPGSKHIPLGALPNRLREVEKHKDRPVLVICRSGNRSTGACGLLKKHGFGEVRALKGGIQAWEQANLPVERK
ncbi:MAG: rhodanese-like domain-containing protein [Betaproteobacteria bacterium]|nr:rhodanese-like domain-containing protein [Betaproteobacteria bacterium]